ncbi:MAG: FYDLN acid domain-containing protein [Verrucomicrobiota bacterium]|jgi:predicted  nucleic acid-binding Zn-ribbon protein|nr:FYDLN acid domain-containing protein [Verrucomicrobiota bacterium]
MKRVVTCPNCETKLAVFDLGKPINQKCPKCGNAFVVESEEKKDSAAGEEKAVETPKAEAPKVVDAPVKAEAPKVADAPVKKETPAPVKEPVKTSGASALPDAPVAPDAPAAAGHSFLFPVVIVGLLILVAALQVMAKRQADRQYEQLIKHLQFIETKVGK